MGRKESNQTNKHQCPYVKYARPVSYEKVFYIQWPWAGASVPHYLIIYDRRHHKPFTCALAHDKHSICRQNNVFRKKSRSKLLVRGYGGDGVWFILSVELCSCFSSIKHLQF